MPRMQKRVMVITARLSFASITLSTLEFVMKSARRRRRMLLAWWCRNFLSDSLFSVLATFSRDFSKRFFFCSARSNLCKWTLRFKCLSGTRCEIRGRWMKRLSEVKIFCFSAKNIWIGFRYKQNRFNLNSGSDIHRSQLAIVLITLSIISREVCYQVRKVNSMRLLKNNIMKWEFFASLISKPNNWLCDSESFQKSAGISK